VKEDEGRPRSHFCKPTASVCHVTPRCEHTLFLHEYFFDFVFHFVCDGWQNRATCLHQVFVKFGKSATETHEMLREAFGEHSLSQTAVFEWHSCFKASWVSDRDDKCSGQTSSSKTTENIEKIRELIHEDRRWTIHELADTVGISYGVCQEILTENLNMRHIAAKSIPLTLDKWSKAVASKHVLRYEWRLMRTQLLLISLGS
jgi:hypothetical protein